MPRSGGFLLALALVDAAAAVDLGTEPVEVVARSCSGVENEYGSCTALPICHRCTPKDCLWSEWGDWVPMGGCSGICSRVRTINQDNNECGRPCEGVVNATKACPNASCGAKSVACEMASWGDWSVCSSSVDQKYRYRMVKQYPEAGGQACSDATKETQPCGEPPKKEDCLLSKWSPWTACTHTCGHGYSTRTRKVEVPSQMGGTLCKGDLWSWKMCEQQPCGADNDCKAGAWSLWSTCTSATSLVQRFRTRPIDSSTKFDGKPCTTNLKETAGCPNAAVDCQLSDWGQWQSCDKTCGGGQRVRKKSVKVEAANGGRCEAPRTSMQEVEPCSTVSCITLLNLDCRFAAWSPWGNCSTECGVGSARRTRGIERYAKADGGGCSGPMAEAKTCTVTKGCQTKDCKWEDWGEWSACSVTCGGGTKRRDREVEQSQQGDGAKCPAEKKSEVAGCGTASCEEKCVNGTWHDWGDWGKCTATCGSGFRSRMREPDQPATKCGWPATGSKEEYAPCPSLPSCTASKNCAMSDWSEWSSCSATCYGIKERARAVANVASGYGIGCNDALKEIRPCNPGAGEKASGTCSSAPLVRDCKLSSWEDWSPCSASCGNGQQSRQRQITVPPQNGGALCDEVLWQTAVCSNSSCTVSDTCQDCEFGAWRDWGSCSISRARSRSREVVKLPNYCGKACPSSPREEVEHCGDEEPDVYCAFSEWSAFTQCPTGCGIAAKRRHRYLSVYSSEPKEWLFKGKGRLNCSGTQYDSEDCKLKPCTNTSCVPVHCRLSDWSSWGSARLAGLCDRHRTVQTANNQCGEPCTGSLVDTRNCGDCKDKLDCKLSDWTTWTECASPEAQRYRERTIVRPPQSGGAACSGSMNETLTCKAEVRPRSCSLSGWSDWASCSVSCGGGTSTRYRYVKEAAVGGGLPCTDSLEELQGCKLESCGAAARDCVWADWHDWGSCNPADQQAQRSRVIKTQGTIGGAPCMGNMEEVRPCQQETQDCAFSQWTDWLACSKTCIGGQRTRHRQVTTYPNKGGKDCPLDLALEETEACNTEKRCDGTLGKNCSLTTWADWSKCSASCGKGQRTRSRKVARLRLESGHGCFEATRETEQCSSAPCSTSQDCRWSDWSKWSSCSHTCGGGQMLRNRSIAQVPKYGGAPCQALDKSQLSPCNTQPCSSGEACTDGVWADWAPWQACSASCGNGTTWRHRAVAKMASSCGKPAVGASQELKACSSKECGNNTDCAFGDWQQWATCTASCDGVRSRSRKIKTHGSGKGTPCSGSLKQTEPCNPINQTKGCPIVHTIACQYAQWSDWSSCPVTCGVGQLFRTRKVVEGACDGALRVTKACGLEPCGGRNATIPVPCRWSDWSLWGACDRCDGQRTRFRSVAELPQAGGSPCSPGSAQETSRCPETCEVDGLALCSWTVWGAWSSCSISCSDADLVGGSLGRRSRQRTLRLQGTPKNASQLWQQGPSHGAEGLEHELESLSEQTKASEAAHFGESAAAFVAGCLSLAGLASALRWTRVTPCDPRSRASWYGPEEEEVHDDDGELAMAISTEES